MHVFVRRSRWSGWTWAWRWTSRCTSGMRRRAWRVSGCVVACACAHAAACVCVVVCAVRFKAPHSIKPSTASSATGHLFHLQYDSRRRKWRGEISLLSVPAYTASYAHPWQPAAALEWQLARWCEHTGQPRSHYVSNAARLVSLGHADADGALHEPVEVEPWDLSPWKSAEEVAASEFANFARLCTWFSRPPPFARSRHRWCDRRVAA